VGGERALAEAENEEQFGDGELLLIEQEEDAELGRIGEQAEGFEH